MYRSDSYHNEELNSASVAAATAGLYNVWQPPIDRIVRFPLIADLLISTNILRSSSLRHSDRRSTRDVCISRFVDDDDPSPVAPLRLSHSGLYINQAQAPSAKHRPDHSNQTDPFQPQPLVVHFDPTIYASTSAKASIGPVRLRTRDFVMMHCGNDTGGIEACERDDLDLCTAERRHWTNTSSEGTAEIMVVRDC